MSPRFASLKPKEVRRALVRVGFFVHHASASHFILKHPSRPDLRVTLPMHNKDLKRRTVQSIIDQSGFTPEEFLRLL